MARAFSVRQPELLACAVPRRVRFAGPLLMPTVPVAVVGLVVALLVGTLGCDEKTPPFPDHLFVPDGAGVISETEGLATGVRVTLESGETFDLGTDAIHQVEGSGGDRGDLLIHGVDNGQPWVSLWPQTLDPVEAGWDLVSHAWELPDAFVFPSGMRLPKAPDFQRVDGGRVPSEEGFYEIARFHANERGEIILIR